MSKHDTGNPPMQHTVRMGIVCAILSAILFPVGVGFGAGFLVGENHPNRQQVCR